MACCVPDNVNCEDKIPSKVATERTYQNRVSAALFLSAVLIQYVLSIMTLANVEDPLVCWGVGVEITDLDVTASFGNALKSHVGAFLLTIGVALMIGVTWIILLQKCALVVVWGTLIFEGLVALALAIASFASPGGGLVGVGITILVFLGLACLVVLFKKKAVDNAAFMLQSAAYCIQYNCSIVLVCVFLLICLIAYSIIPIAGLAASYLAGTWRRYDDGFPGCYLDQMPWINASRYVCSFFLAWGFFVFSMMRTYVVGTTTALWYWHPESTGRPLTGLRRAFTYSFGTIALGGLVITILDRINRWASSKITTCCCCCNPVYLIVYILMMIYKEVINALAKFCMVIAAVTGEDFFVCVGRSYYTLKGKFTTLFVVDGVARLVMYGAATVCAYAMWGFAWFVAAGISGEDTIGLQSTQWNTSSSFGGTTLNRIVFVLLWFLACLLVYYPLIGILIIILCGNLLFGTIFGTSYLIGVFAGCLANYLFTFFADVILDVATAMFTIVRIDNKNGIKIQGDMAAGSPHAVGNFFFKLTEEGETTEMTTKAGGGGATVVQQTIVVQSTGVVHPQPVMMAQPMMAQPVMAQPMMAQPMMAQPMMAQPMMAQPMMAAPAYGTQPAYGQPYGGPPGYTPAADPYDASKTA